MEEAHAQQASIHAESNRGLPAGSTVQPSPVARDYEVSSARPVESPIGTMPVRLSERETSVAVAEPEIAETERASTEAAPIIAAMATLLPVEQPEDSKAVHTTDSLHDETGVNAPAVQATAANDGKLDKLRDAIVLALDEKGHQTASALMGSGSWRQVGDTVEVQVAVKKLMLGLVMNPEADRIAKGVMREIGLVPKLSVIPGEGGPGSSAARAVPQGSVQAQAMENPLVKQAQELFRAEVRSILDLRDKR